MRWRKQILMDGNIEWMTGDKEKYKWFLGEFNFSFMIDLEYTFSSNLSRDQ